MARRRPRPAGQEENRRAEGEAAVDDLAAMGSAALVRRGLWFVVWVVAASLASCEDPSGDDDGGKEEHRESGTPVYDLTHHTWGYQEDSKKDATFLLAFAMLVMVSLLLSWIVNHRWHLEAMPEACVVLTVGLVAGFACKSLYGETHRDFFSRPLLGFDNALFFLGLLPPIIFHSGYDLHPRWLFGLFWQIMGFAMLGTFLSALIVAFVLKLASAAGLAPGGLTLAETLTFGALVSATDPVSVIAVFSELRVDPKLFYLVFGESVMNDAVGIVLFKTFSKFVGYSHGAASLAIGFVDFVVIFGGSMVLGALCALSTALVLRCLRCDIDAHHDRRSPEERAEAERASRTLQLAVARRRDQKKTAMLFNFSKLNPRETHPRF